MILQNKIQYSKMNIVYNNTKNVRMMSNKYEKSSIVKETKR